MEKAVVVDTGEIQRALFHHGLHAWQKSRGLAFLYKLLAGSAQLRGDAIFHAKESAKLAGQPALANHLLEQIA